MEPKIERRAFKRVRLINWPAKILIKDRSMSGTTRNISPKGAFIYYFQPHGDDRPLKLHKVVDLIIEAPGVAPLFICAEVIWSNILSSDEKNTLLGMGLRFIEVPDKELQFLHDFIAVHTNVILKRIYSPTRT
jgi:c-di-GMP-binding flagellar brake protein YcgR